MQRSVPFRATTLGALVWLTACGAVPRGMTLDDAPTDQAAIIDGTPATGQFPETGALLILSGELCTATLIAPDVVLTAGHCVAAGAVDSCTENGGTNCPAQVLPTTPQTVSIGYAFLRQQDISQIDHNQVYKAHRAVLHPRYRLDPCSSPQTSAEESACQTLVAQCSGAQTDADYITCVQQLPADVRALVDPTQNHNAYDIGLVFLDASVPNQTPATLAVPQDAAGISAGASVVIAGYGQRSNPNASDPNAVPTDVGAEYWGTTTIQQAFPLEIALGNQGTGTESCHGDSGGPAYVDFHDGVQPVRRIVGVTSRSLTLTDTCEAGSLYTRVDALYDWISSAMEQAYQNGDRVTHVGPLSAHAAAPSKKDGGCQEATGSSLLLVGLAWGVALLRRRRA